MTKSELPALLSQLRNSKLTGRKLTRIICHNINVLKDYIVNEEKIFVGEAASKFNMEIIEKEMNILNAFKNDEERMSYMTNVKKTQEDVFNVLQQFDTFKQHYFNKNAIVELVPIPERLLPKDISIADRYPIEMLIEI